MKTRMMKTKSQELLEAVAELSPSASKLLLVLLLGQGSLESQPQVASIIGCSRRSVARAVSELKARGLIVSIAQDAKYCLALSGAVLPAFVNDEGGDLAEENGETDETDETDETEEATPINIGETEGPDIVTDPLEMCRLADEKQDRKAQVKALQAVWDEVYPEDEYPYQRLQESKAKALLIGHSAVFVGSGIAHGKATAKGEIKFPVSYTQKVLTTFKLPEQSKQEVPMATDELWALVELGQRTFGPGGGEAGHE